VVGGGADGIHITSTGFDALVERNQSFANGDDGIDIDVAGVRVESNWTKSNADWGIEAVPGVIDDRRNRARKNGQPEQCLNVRCRPGG
jgi:hypothetical protein